MRLRTEAFLCFYYPKCLNVIITMNDVRAGFEFILSNLLISLTGKLRLRWTSDLPKVS